ncbi:hypothetical protein AYI68_g659 [Smittium mucronatum]|uniref:Uncharacterized protein n=1 Tax=Smittium mucronatum TaxID=133383 RepID=A0A1R0H7V9_9FUNG|nr:hypothetical protein AYI68_g659 [Smittium mucronatum]
MTGETEGLVRHPVEQERGKVFSQIQGSVNDPVGGPQHGIGGMARILHSFQGMVCGIDEPDQIDDKTSSEIE